MSKSVELRPVVRAFAEAMELKLRENDHKPGWKDDDPEILVDRLMEEVGELQYEVEGLSSNREWPGEREKVLREAADVANFAMMVADVVGSLRTDK